MRALLYAVCTFVIIMMISAGAFAQSGRSRQGGESKKSSASDSGQARPQSDKSSEPEKEAPQETETVRIDTNLVTVPVIVSTRGGTYVPDMRQDEFIIMEDGVQQEVAFFATVTEPFHVVLMIDTSASTEEKLYQIRKAANAFVTQLQQSDRVKLISFDDRVREYGEFTSDRALLSGMIDQLRSGSGTKLYDAMDVALKSLERIRGRKAVVIFTDGVDWYSDRKDYTDNFRSLEESGVIVYPIRYDTRAETERLARAQASGGQRVDLGTIFGGGLPRGTPTTFPGGQSIPTTTGGSTPRMPGPVVITTGRGGTNDPTGPDATSRYPDTRNDPTRPTTTPQQQEDAAISRMLDAAYLKADSYLNDLSYRSGGKLMRADTLGNLPDAFSQIAAELRTQYSLGYYPPKGSRDGKLHKIQVRSTRKDVQVRSRPAYRSKSSSQ
ncbi:MAG TPA: VWA domain-containing protein [Pyrinomonadaceae bacterium]|nr:VWA domain-containing protein [Pyrinomonadaceae bacterium]